MLKERLRRNAERAALIAELDTLVSEQSDATHWNAPLSARAQRIAEIRWAIARLEDD
jgi:hypothetical protein